MYYLIMYIMRNFLLSLLVILTLSSVAQSDYQYRISSFMSEDATKTFTYQYAESTGADLRGVHEINLLEIPVWELIDSLHYDEEGRIIQIATHQCFDGEWRRVCWIDYTYNEMGLKETRKNYNDFNDGYGGVLGGIYYYYYDEEGRMTNWLLDFDNYDFQKGELTYNEDGLLESELIMQDPFIGVMDNYGLIEYYYDENGNNTEIITKTWGYTDWVYSSLQFNTYDEAGNCIEIVSSNASGVAQEKRTYNYDMNVLAENVYYFSNPENKFPTMPQMHNMVTSYEQWLINQNNGELSFAGNFLFSYEEIGDVDLSVSIDVPSTTIDTTVIELNANVIGGTGNYTYSWTPSELLDDATIQNPTATFEEDGSYTFTVTVDDGETTAEASVTIEVVAFIGVEENILNDVSIYPNPAEDFIMINSENVESVDVLDIYGRIVTSLEINCKTRIDMSNFANGIYYVRIHSNGATTVKKVIKN